MPTVISTSTKHLSINGLDVSHFSLDSLHKHIPNLQHFHISFHYVAYGASLTLPTSSIASFETQVLGDGGDFLSNILSYLLNLC